LRKQTVLTSYFGTLTSAAQILQARGRAAALALMGMLGEDVDVICAPYPRKRILCGTKFGRSTSDHAYSWPLRRLAPDAPSNSSAASACRWRAFGFALIKREAAARVASACFANGETFTDWCEGKTAITALAFQLLVTTDQYRQLLSEDNSFCQRAIDAGCEVFLYVGPGAPLDTWGRCDFLAVIGACSGRPYDDKEQLFPHS